MAVAFRYPSPTRKKKMMLMMMMISCTPLFFPIIFFSFTHPKPYHPFETLYTWLEKKKEKRLLLSPKLQSAAAAKAKKRRSEARSQNRAMEKEAPKTGTTIVACEYADGIVIGADTRVSTGTFCVGIFVNNFSFRFSPFVPLFVASRSHRSSLSRDDNNNNNRDVHFQSRVG